ncbi:hypothetical protein C9427_12530 [Mesorhizobium helmanticense]|uniref:Uncharacterized protein n=1 Tax=Mesorhizobium helmanticense TaxID=1776423 RepID=A0A2T4IWB0_9HYPH|nr:hypothetical protein C9427_12530 [Mesorhizobium helmanticense]
MDVSTVSKARPTFRKGDFVWSDKIAEKSKHGLGFGHIVHVDRRYTLVQPQTVGSHVLVLHKKDMRPAEVRTHFGHTKKVCRNVIDGYIPA